MTIVEKIIKGLKALTTDKNAGYADLVRSEYSSEYKALRGNPKACRMFIMSMHTTN